MEKGFYLFGIIVFAFGAAWLGLKIFEMYRKYRYELYKDNSSEFIADLYKLKMKWVRRGEFMYCKAIDKVIGAETEQYEDIPGNPETSYGKDVLLQMKNVIDSEARKRSDILE